MKKNILVWPVVLAMLGYLVFNYIGGRMLSLPALLGELLIVGVAAAGFLEAGTVCWMVLTSPDADLGKLADHRVALAVGLVAGLIFAGLTCASEFGVNISREQEQVASEIPIEAEGTYQVRDPSLSNAIAKITYIGDARFQFERSDSWKQTFVWDKAQQVFMGPNAQDRACYFRNKGVLAFETQSFWYR